MEIQRGNAASVMGTAETSKDWDRYFLLLSYFLGQDRGFVFLNFKEAFWVWRSSDIPCHNC